MKRTLSLLIPLFLMAITFSGCEAIGDLIGFGMWLGVILVVLVLLVVFWIIRKIKK